MPHFPEATRRWWRARAFRTRFLLAMMLVVAAITAAVFVFVQVHVSATQQRNLEERFQGQTNYLLAMRIARLTAITDKCRSLSHSVRIRAALEEDDVDDLYSNAQDELRGVIDAGGNGAIDPSMTSGNSPRGLPRANFFGFVNAHGEVLAPTGAPDDGKVAGAAVLARFAGLATAGRRFTNQQETGYLLVPRTRGSDMLLDEVIVSPIENPAAGEPIGALVLGFPADISRSEPASTDHATTGIWVSGTIRGLNAPGNAIPGLLEALNIGVSESPRAGHFPVQVNGAPALLFYQTLDVGDYFPPAFGVCLYPLTASLQEQRALRWRVIGWGGAALGVGFVLSFLLSGHLSAPVERLAIGAMENLAGRRRAEAELIETNRQLEGALIELKATQAQVIQQERLRALGEMASGIAHDFNNALMPILGFSELLVGMPHILEDHQKVIGYLQIINRGAKDAGNVVRRLREFYRSREDDEQFLPLSLDQLATQAAELTQPKWKDQALVRGVAIELRTAIEAVPSIWGNESDLREALTNLVFNAVDAMPKGGILTLRVRHGGDAGIVEVSDTGTGMSEAVRRRCLEPFFSTKGDGGTGLGLSMVFGIVQRHAGTVEIDSQEGEGSTFRLRLPFRKAGTESETAIDAPPVNGAVGHHALRVLAVDDEPAVREILTHLLESEGHQVVTAGSARDALHCIHTNTFDLVITDMAMPGMNGEELASTVKTVTPRLPVVLLTGFGGFLDSSPKPSGVDVLASKPITLQGLRHCIQAALAPRELAV